MNEGGRQRLNNPTVDGARPTRGFRRCRAAVRRSPDRWGCIVGIEVPSRSIEDVVLTDGACRDLPRADRKDR